MTAFPMPAEDTDGVPSPLGDVSRRRLPCCGCPSTTRSRSSCSTSPRPWHPAAPCRRSGSWPGSTGPRARPSGRRWPSWSSRDACCGCRARAPSSPSRRSPSRSSSPATPRGCGSTACTRRPRSSTSATSPPTRSWRRCSTCDRAGGCCASTGCGSPTASRCRSTPRTCPPAGSPACGGSSSGTPRCTRRCAPGTASSSPRRRRRSRPCSPTRTTPACSASTPASRCCCCRGTRSTPPGEPVEWAQSWYRGDRYKFITRLRRGPMN